MDFDESNKPHTLVWSNIQGLFDARDMLVFYKELLISRAIAIKRRIIIADEIMTE